MNIHAKILCACHTIVLVLSIFSNHLHLLMVSRNFWQEVLCYNMRDIHGLFQKNMKLLCVYSQNRVETQPVSIHPLRKLKLVHEVLQRATQAVSQNFETLNPYINTQ